MTIFGYFELSCWQITCLKFCTFSATCTLLCPSKNFCNGHILDILGNYWAIFIATIGHTARLCQSRQISRNSNNSNQHNDLNTGTDNEIKKTNIFTRQIHNGSLELRTKLVRLALEIPYGLRNWWTTKIKVVKLSITGFWLVCPYGKEREHSTKPMGRITEWLLSCLTGFDSVVLLQICNYFQVWSNPI